MSNIKLFWAPGLCCWIPVSWCHGTEQEKGKLINQLLLVA